MSGGGGWRLAGDNECRMYVTHSIVYLYLLVLVHIVCLEYAGIVRGSLDVEPLNWLAVIFSGCQWMELSKQWMSVDVSGCQWILVSFIWDEVKFYRYCWALSISELMKMISFQYNCQCMLLVSSRWLTSYASKWGGGSKAVLASSGWLKIVLENSE